MRQNRLGVAVAIGLLSATMGTFAGVRVLVTFAGSADLLLASTQTAGVTQQRCKVTMARPCAGRSSRNRHTRFRHGEQVATWSIDGSSMSETFEVERQFPKDVFGRATLAFRVRKRMASNPLQLCSNTRHFPTGSGGAHVHQQQRY
jgi:hypothetical protein